MTMIPRQNSTAWNTPSRFSPSCRFTKYETVNGIIGKTQGVKMAASPAPNAVSRKRPNPAEVCGAAEGAVGVPTAVDADSGAEEAAAGLNSLKPVGMTITCDFAAGSMFNVAVAVLRLGGRHLESLQH